MSIPATYTAAVTLETEFDQRMGDLLASMQKHLQVRRKTGTIPLAMFRLFAKQNQEVAAITLAKPPVIDGVINTEEWKGAYPTGSVFEAAKGEITTSVPAEFMTALDGENLSVAFKAPYLPASADSAQRRRELIRLYLHAGDKSP